MLILFLLAGLSYGLREDDNFQVTQCGNGLKFTIDKDYLDDNLAWQVDQVGFFMRFIQ